MSKHGPYVDIAPFGLSVDPRYHKEGWTEDARILGRESAVKALIRAQNALPEGYKFLVWDFQRTLEVQLKMIASFRVRFKTEHPEWDDETVEKNITEYAAKPLPDDEVVRKDCHRNGGAVDLTIIGPDGKELDMGTDHDDLTDLAHTMHFHRIPNPTPEQAAVIQNRQMLIDAMTRGGWDNYSVEWWHWSTTE